MMLADEGLFEAERVEPFDQFMSRSKQSVGFSPTR